MSQTIVIDKDCFETVKTDLNRWDLFVKVKNGCDN